MKYTRLDLVYMRELLTEDELYRKVEPAVEIAELSDEQLIEYFEDWFGEDYLNVVDEKDHKNGLYGDEEYGASPLSEEQD